MSRFTPSQLVFMARQHFESDRWNAADDLCRKVLCEYPARADALHLRARIASHAGRHGAAAEFLRQAVAVEPDSAALHGELGRILRLMSKLDEALPILRHAARLAPEDASILCELVEALEAKGDVAEAVEALGRALRALPRDGKLNMRLGDLLLRMGQVAEAVTAFESAAASQPANPAARLKLGSALEAAGRIDEAIVAFRAAAELDPRLSEPLDRLGVALLRVGQVQEAVDSFRQALARTPAYMPAHLHLGDCLLEMGFADAAMEQYRTALTLKPTDRALLAQLQAALPDEAVLDEAIARAHLATERHPADAQAFCNLGVAYHRRRNVDAAIAAYRQALLLDPNHAAAMNNLGLSLKDVGQLDESISVLRKAVALNPDLPECHGNLLYLLHFHPDSDDALLQWEHAAWRQRHADPLKSALRPHDNDRAPRRRLRIGYVSPNFRQHSVGRFLTALFENHDRDQFEIVAYSGVRRPDAITARVGHGCDRWIDIAHLSDAELAEKIRTDRIDVLVDLTMHMADSRLLAFARKPAPVQLTYLAYCSITGLDAIDYRLTDRWLDPGQSDGVKQPTDDGSERPLHLRQSYWCYDPAIETPAVNSLPALSRGHVTFASMNNFCKASPAALSLWAALLRAVPSAQLMLHAWPGEHRERTGNLFVSEGVDASRLRFFDMLSLPQYFRLHHAVDIALDSFPYPGGTTTCDALWMGVPTISLVGQAPFTRSGLSILSNVGLPELAVQSREQYLKTAIELAGDLPRLERLRSTMRDRMRASPLMDGRHFARDVEAAYHLAWDRWCRNGE